MILIQIATKLVGAYVTAGGSYYFIKRCWPDQTKDFWLLVALIWIVSVSAALLGKAPWTPLSELVIRIIGSVIIGGTLYYFGKRKLELDDRVELILYSTSFPFIRILMAIFVAI